MEEKSKKSYALSIIFILIAVVYTLLVKYVDVKPIGPESSSVGFSKLNYAVSSKIGVHEKAYDFTKYLGYIAMLVILAYALIGVVELIKRKSIKKVDKQIIALGCFFIVVLMVYALFEVVVINYRPVILDEGLEASYPSSHTMLALCVFGSAIMVNNKLFKDKKCTKLINNIFAILACLMVVGRLISGVHWFSDILGGVIISVALLVTFSTILNNIEVKENNK